MRPLGRVRNLALSAGVGVSLALLLVSVDFYWDSLKLQGYRLIQVGMSSEDVNRISEQTNLPCHLGAKDARHPSDFCRFSDRWYSYVIQADPESGRVARKTMKPLVKEPFATKVSRILREMRALSN